MFAAGRIGSEDPWAADASCNQIAAMVLQSTDESIDRIQDALTRETVLLAHNMAHKLLVRYFDISIFLRIFRYFDISIFRECGFSSAAVADSATEGPLGKLAEGHPQAIAAFAEILFEKLCVCRMPHYVSHANNQSMPAISSYGWPAGFAWVFLGGSFWPI